MFTQQLPASVFVAQREMIRLMALPLDFEWWAKTLVKEEAAELREAYERKELSDENMADIFKELADTIYVVAGFYNTMPVYAPEVVDEGRNQEIQAIMDDAAEIVSTVSQKLRIPLPLILEAFDRVHQSNLTKLDDEGNPIRREDGKVLKGPNYVPPDMMPVVEAWKIFQNNEPEQGVEDAEIVGES